MIHTGISSLLADLLRIGGICRNIKPQEALQTMSGLLERLLNTSPEEIDQLKRQLYAPESLHWAPLGEEIAMPHLRLPPSTGNVSGLFSLLLLSEPMPLPVATPDGLPVKHLLFFVSPSAKAHIQMVGQISSHLMHGPFKKLLENRACDDEFLKALAADPKSR